MSTPELESELEAELKRMAPSEPSERLQVNLARKLEPEKAHRTSWLRWTGTFVPLAVAAGIVLALIIRGPSLDIPQGGSQLDPVELAPIKAVPATDAAGDVFIPIKAINQLYDARYLGMVTTPDGGTARQVVYRYLDTVTWQNQASKATFEFTVPRDEVHLIAATGF